MTNQQSDLAAIIADPQRWGEVAIEGVPHEVRILTDDWLCDGKACVAVRVYNKSLGTEIHYVFHPTTGRQCGTLAPPLRLIPKPQAKYRRYETPNEWCTLLGKEVLERNTEKRLRVIQTGFYEDGKILAFLFQSPNSCVGLDWERLSANYTHPDGTPLGVREPN